jgi:hypothetical protein
LISNNYDARVALGVQIKKPPGKMNFAEGLDPPIFFREEKNEQVPVHIIHAASLASVRYRT